MASSDSSFKGPYWAYHLKQTFGGNPYMLWSSDPDVHKLQAAFIAAVALSLALPWSREFNHDEPQWYTDTVLVGRALISGAVIEGADLHELGDDALVIELAGMNIVRRKMIKRLTNVCSVAWTSADDDLRRLRGPYLTGVSDEDEDEDDEDYHPYGEKRADDVWRTIPSKTDPEDDTVVPELSPRCDDPMMFDESDSG